MTTDPSPVEPSSTLQTLSRLDFEGADRVRKWGSAPLLRREVEPMNYVHAHTSIPVPKILDSHFEDDADDDKSWILIQKPPGLQLGSAWPDMDAGARQETTRQLKSHLQQLHRLHPPRAGWIGSVSRGPAFDHRLSNMSTCGPFTSVSEFHDFLAAPVRSSPRPEWFEKYRSQLADTYGVRVSHADLLGENILLDPSTGNVTGVLDWEMAGFWPEWWEFRKALFGSRSQPW